MEMRKKEFTYRGKTLEELKNLDVREFAKLLRSRQRRTVLRQFQEVENFVKKAKKNQEKNKKIRTHDRYLIIVPELVGMKIQVYNGSQFIPFEVTGEMLGHRLGEFAPTRARIKHTKAGVGATKGTKHKSKK
ncbi:30S ribosomal protein S19 [Candidatus Pacearchaeota archaeon ex4484_71]|nr:MAG: 30S ribosomal protein S19 [Candidatus Pacearchaeota archaeon ex4484_71]